MNNEKLEKVTKIIGITTIMFAVVALACAGLVYIDSHYKVAPEMTSGVATDPDVQVSACFRCKSSGNKIEYVRWERTGVYVIMCAGCTASAESGHNLHRAVVNWNYQQFLEEGNYNWITYRNKCTETSHKIDTSSLKDCWFCDRYRGARVRPVLIKLDRGFRAVCPEEKCSAYGGGIGVGRFYPTADEAIDSWNEHFAAPDIVGPGYGGKMI